MKRSLLIVIGIVIILSLTLVSCKEGELEITDPDGNPVVTPSKDILDSMIIPQTDTPEWVNMKIYSSLFNTVYDIGGELMYSDSIKESLRTTDLSFPNTEKNIAASIKGSIYHQSRWQCLDQAQCLQIPYGEYTDEKGAVRYLYWNDDVKIEDFDTTSVGERWAKIINGDRIGGLKYAVSNIEEAPATTKKLLDVKIAERTQTKFYRGQFGENSGSTYVYLDLVYDNSKSTGGVRVSGLDTSKVGSYKTAVEYKGFTVDYQYEVHELKNVLSFGKSVLKEYYLPLNLEQTSFDWQLPVALMLDDGKDSTIEVNGKFKFDFDCKTKGTKTLDFTFEGKPLRYTYHVLDVVNITQKYEIPQYNLFGTKPSTAYFDVELDGGSVYTYSADVSDIDLKAEPGLKTKELTICGQTVSYKYEVLGVKGITAKNWKTLYTVGEEFFANKYTSSTEDETVEQNDGKITFSTNSLYNQKLSAPGSAEDPQDPTETPQDPTSNKPKYSVSYREGGSIPVIWDEVPIPIVIPTDLEKFYPSNLNIWVEVNRISAYYTFDTTAIVLDIPTFDIALPYSAIQDNLHYIKKTYYSDGRTVEEECTVENGGFYGFHMVPIEVELSNGKTMNVTLPTSKIAEVDVTGFDTSAVGKKEMTVDYYGYKCQLPYEVINPDKVSVNEQKTMYLGDTISSTASITLQQGDKAYTDIAPVYAYDSTYFNTATACRYSKGQIFMTEVTFPYIGIKDIKQRSDMTVVQGEQATYVSADVTYADGTTKHRSITYSLDTSTLGERKFTFSYYGQSKEFTYVVKDKGTFSIDDEYAVLDKGQKVSSVTIIVTHSDGKTESKSVSLNDLDTSVVGKASRELTFTWGGEQCSFTYEYEVADKIESIEPYLKGSTDEQLKNKYGNSISYQRDSWLHYENAGTVKVLIHYKNGSVAVANADEGSVDTQTVGERSVVAKYRDKECTFNYTVREITDIAISEDTRTRFAIGEQQRSVRLILSDDKGSYTNDISSSANISAAYSLSYSPSVSYVPIDTSTPGKKTCKIKHYTYEKEFEFEVCEVKSIEAAKQAILYCGNSLSSLNVTITWADGKTSEDQIHFSKSITVDEIGDKGHIDIAYPGYSFTYTYQIATITSINEDSEEKIYMLDGSTTSYVYAEIKYSDGSKKSVSVALDSPIVFDTVGEFSIGLVYEGIHFDYKYKVLSVTSMEIAKSSGNVEDGVPVFFVSNGAFCGSTSIRFNCVLSDGSAQNYSYNDSKKISTTPGEYDLTVTYGGFEKVVHYKVVGTTASPKEKKYTYYVGDLNDCKYSYEISYSDGRQKKEGTGYIGKSTLTAGGVGTDLTLSVSASGYNFVIKYDLLAPTAVSAYVNPNPVEDRSSPNDTTQGGIFIGYIPNYSYYYDDCEKYSQQTEFIVREKAEVRYYYGSSLALKTKDGIFVTVSYADGTSRVALISFAEGFALDTATVGEKSFTFDVFGYKYEFVYTVVEAAD